MAVHFDQTSGFISTRTQIEDYRYCTTLEESLDEQKALESVEKFANDLESVFSTLDTMHQTPRENDSDGIKSFPVSEGRYRLFYKVRITKDGNFIITLLDIDDNKQSNLDRFPAHSIIDFDDES